MKNINRVVTAVVLFVFVIGLIGCGSKASKTVAEGVLGKLPILAQQAMHDMQDLMQKADQLPLDANGMQKRIELKKEYKELKKQAEAEMEAIIKATDGMVIPFDQQGSRDRFVVKSIKLTGVNRPNEDGVRINFQAEVETKDKVASKVGQWNFVDKDSNILKTEMFYLSAAEMPEIDAGKTTIFYGNPYIEGLSNLSKIVIP